MRCNRHQHYTLVELLVAVAVLALMMTFLFQFIFSAQRVWSASHSDSDAFAQANITLDYITNDLRNVRFSMEPQREMPFFYNVDAQGNKLLAYIQQEEENDEAQLTLLYYDKTAKKIYRILRSDDTDYFWFGVNGEDLTSEKLTEFTSKFTAYLNNTLLVDENELATGVENLFVDFQYKVTGTLSSGDFVTNYQTSGAHDRFQGFAKKELPLAIRVTLQMEIREKQESQKNETTLRSFSKIIFLR